MVAKRAFMLAVALMGGIVGTAKAQSQRTPPAAIVAIARNAAQTITGVVPTHEYVNTYNMSDMTGHMVWGINLGGPGVDIDIDETLGRVISFFCASSNRASIASAAAGQPLAITQTQAVANVMSLSQPLSAWQGDLRLDSVEVKPIDGNKNSFTWHVSFKLYVNNWPVASPAIYACVNQYNGSIAYWSTFVCDCVPVTSPLLSPEQAQAIAVAAFQSAEGSSSITPELPAGEPCWEQVTPYSSIYKLAYMFFFTYKDSDGNAQSVVVADLDAQTGEIWLLRCMTGGIAAGKFKEGTVSPRYALVSTLLKDKKSAGLGRAVVSGKLAKRVKPDAKARKFAWAVDKRHVDFTLDAKGRTLAWKEGGKAWSGVTLSAGESTKLAAWLKASAL